MVLTIGLLAWWSREWRNRRAGLLALYNAGVLVVLTLLPMAFGWPGFKDSLEDTFTNHYAKPTPPDLYGKWISLNRHFWLATAKNYLHDPLVPALLILGAVLLWRYRRDFGAIVGAAALTGLVSAAAHPLTSQLDRLYFQVYLLGICGLPILADLIQRQPGLFEAVGASRAAAEAKPGAAKDVTSGATDDGHSARRKADPDAAGSFVRTT